MSATVTQLAARRPVQPFDRAAILQRNRAAFAAGDQARRMEAAAQLQALAAALLNGEASTLLEARTCDLLALLCRERGKA